MPQKKAKKPAVFVKTKVQPHKLKKESSHFHRAKMGAKFIKTAESQTAFNQIMSQYKKQANYHDIFFKNFYSNPDFVFELLQFILSKKELSACDWKHLKAEKDSLKDKRADLIFSVPLKNSPKTQIKIFILLEHKSYQDPLLFRQLLSYQTRLYEESLRSGITSIIIPVVFYHGKTPWKGPKTFQEDIYKGILSKIPAEFRRSMINYEIKLLDTNKLKGVFNNKSFKSRGALYLLKRIWSLQLSHDQLKDVMIHFKDFSGDRQNRLIVSVTDYLQSFFKMDKKFEKLWQKVEKELVEEGIFKRGGHMDAIKHIEERGHIKGLRKGLRKGRQEVILKMLEKKLDIKLISEVTGVSTREIKKLKNGA